MCGYFTSIHRQMLIFQTLDDWTQTWCAEIFDVKRRVVSHSFHHPPALFLQPLLLQQGSYSVEMLL